MKLWKHIEHLRNTAPLVHNITNFVVMNNSANALLAIGASPIMAHAKEEVPEMVKISNALVINIGTLDPTFIEGMLLAAKTAHELGKPWILDPVGAGVSHLRNSTIQKLLEYHPTVIRGNASEVVAVSSATGIKSKGVDSSMNSSDAVESGKELHKNLGTIVCISGATDYLISKGQIFEIQNGDPMMTKVTGLGCSLSAVLGAVLGASGADPEAIASVVAYFGISGELAKGLGPGSLQVQLLDHLYSIDQSTFENRLKICSYTW
ncbi:hydroxyethylthiazole kinase [Leadbetterella byssophila DSM 17132]|uniref:Hydroxyethylthiazole kinase n=1 Tax=Leadbetterella byssophila (strain DSM 17132 / JCM 16389 / KACC 11308 / NBRC 106382 / 4M15) TaxID=649349 RepID=E4RW18_LEAB4|nr:hydroxyethylthiazole kinase [Leadbetterella byssophila]ADQ16161.1 hydroxyethylthiazole kinase [Leadbetterella byssophila DSM 17132]